jgi:hypothetical protein
MDLSAAFSEMRGKITNLRPLENTGVKQQSSRTDAVRTDIK